MTTLEQLNAQLTEAEAAHNAASRALSVLRAEKRQVDSLAAGFYLISSLSLKLDIAGKNRITRFQVQVDSQSSGRQRAVRY